jgi:hypothetical protein
MNDSSVHPPATSPQEDIHPDDLVPADDRVIGHAFRWSALACLLLGIVAGGVWWVLSRPADPGAIIKVDPVPAGTPLRPVEPPAIPFTDITSSAGITFTHTSGATGDKLLPETMGGGVAFLDYNNDGHQDLLLVNSTHWPDAPAASSPPTHALYRNNGDGTFTNVTAGSGLDVSFYGMGAAVGDYDNDGHIDVFITAVGSNRLFRNVGGRFVDVTASAGVAGDPAAWSTSAAFIDFDHDGRLDLFVCNYVKWSRDIDFAVNYQLTGIGRAYGPPTNFVGAQSYLYRNNGNGTFTDISAAAGIHVVNPATGVPVGKALAVVPVDVNNDGFIDLIVANDTTRNFLFINNRDGAFSENGERLGVAYDRTGNSTGAMGIDAAHYCNNPDLGVVVGNFANEMSSLYVLRRGQPSFTDESIGEGIGAPTRLRLTFGAFFFDADLDARLDLLHANGHIEDDINIVQSSQHYQQPGQLFWNAGPDTSACFVEVPAARIGDLARPIVGRGAAFADIDSDGDLDVILTQVNAPPLLLRNDQSFNHNWLRVRLVGDGRTVNRDAIGAVIELSAAGVTQRQTVMPARSYLSQVELPVTFGLGKAAAIDSLTITWPGGAVQSLTNVPVNRSITIEQAAK